MAAAAQSQGQGAQRRWSFLLLGAVLVAALGFVVARLAPGSQRRPGLPVTVSERPSSAVSMAPSRAAEPAATRDETLVNAAPDASRADDALRPHPITPAHERLFRENQLIGALYGAMDVRDGPGVRRLADQYRKEFPDDPSQLEEGYDVIAACLEHPSPASAAAARKYDEEQRGSILRRFVRRYCLEP